MTEYDMLRLANDKIREQSAEITKLKASIVAIHCNARMTLQCNPCSYNMSEVDLIAFAKAAVDECEHACPILKEGTKP